MKKTTRPAARLVLALALALALALPGAAAGVIFDGTTHSFTLYPGSDLFDAQTDNMLPGDTCTETIALQVNNTWATTLYFSQQAGSAHREPPDATRLDDCARLTLELLDGSGKHLQTLYSGALGGSVGPDVSLGSWTGTRYLRATIHLPEQLDSGYMDALDTVCWTFYAVQQDGGQADTDTAIKVVQTAYASARAPQTGDTVRWAYPVASGMLAGAGILLLRRNGTKKRK